VTDFLPRRDRRAELSNLSTLDLLDLVADLVAAKVIDRLDAVSLADGQHDAFLDVEQAAAYLACDRRRIYDLVAQQKVEHYRDGKRLLFRRCDLDTYLTRVEATP
jgi:excisionase family DNA binding protein